jgi:hypothetical protein
MIVTVRKPFHGPGLYQHNLSGGSNKIAQTYPGSDVSEQCCLGTRAAQNGITIAATILSKSIAAQSPGREKVSHSQSDYINLQPPRLI